MSARRIIALVVMCVGGAVFIVATQLNVLGTTTSCPEEIQTPAQILACTPTDASGDWMTSNQTLTWFNVGSNSALISRGGSAQLFDLAGALAVMWGLWVFQRRNDGRVVAVAVLIPIGAAIAALLVNMHRLNGYIVSFRKSSSCTQLNCSVDKLPGVGITVLLIVFLVLSMIAGAFICMASERPDETSIGYQELDARMSLQDESWPTPPGG